MSNGYDETHDSVDLAPGDEHLEGGSLAQRVLGYALRGSGWRSF